MPAVIVDCLATCPLHRLSSSDLDAVQPNEWESV